MKSLVFFAAFYMLSVFAGSISDPVMSRLGAKKSLIFRTVFGGCIVMITGMAVCLVGGIFTLPTYICAVIAAAIIIITGLAGTVAGRSNRAEGSYIPSSVTATAVLLTAVSAAVVAGQIYGIHVLRFEDPAAIRNIGIATYVFESGKMCVADPMMLFTGTVSSILHVHPLELVYTVLPSAFVLFYYLCYLEVICTVCSGNGRFVAFMAVAALNLWGYQSEVLIPATLLLSWFGTWVFVIHGLLNVAAVVAILYVKNKPERPADAVSVYDDDLMEEWDMNKHRIINARNLAIALGVLAVALAGFVIVLNSKINKLYDATVNLQQDLYSRCSIYEFVPQTGRTEGYLVRTGNNQLTFIGGGSSENAEELEDFIKQYGTDITDWYVYADDEENAGAMHSLESGGQIVINAVYVIDRKEIKGLE